MKTLALLVYFLATFLVASLEEHFSEATYDVLRNILTIYIPIAFILFALAYLLFEFFKAYSFPVFNFKARRNLKKLKATFGQVLQHECQENSISFVSCCVPLVDRLLPLCKTKASRTDASRWPENFDYIELSYRLIISFSFDLVSSGQYHIYRGMLSPQGEALYKLYRHNLHHALERNLLSEQDYIEQLDIIRENIDSVG